MAKRTFAFVTVFAALLSVTLSVQAEDLDYYWAGSNTSMFTAGNWKVGSPDGPAATVSLTASGYNLDLYVDSTSQTITFDNSNFGSIRTLNIGTVAGTTTAAVQRTGGNPFVFANGKTLNIYKGGSFTFNNSGVEFQTSGTINLSGGTFTIQGALNFRLANANNATLTISAGDLTVNSDAYIGVSPYTGTINQTGGSATFNRHLDLGWGNGAVGQYNLTGGTITTTGPAGLWTGNPTGVSTFTVNGGTANFTQAGESFTVGLGGTNQLKNVFTITSGTVNVTDTFAVKYTGILNINGGEFNAPTITVDSVSTLNMTGGSLKTNAINMNGGTFTQGGGSLVYNGKIDVTGNAVLNGTIDMSKFLGTYNQTVDVVEATSITGSPSVRGDWTLANDGTKITATYTGGAGKYYWTGATNNTYNTGTNWSINGAQYTETYITGSPATFDKDCYILTSNGAVDIDWGDFGVASLTVGNGVGGSTGTAEISRGGDEELKTQLTINKGGTATFGGAFSITSYNGTPATLTVNGGDFNASSSTTVSGKIVVDDGNYNANGAVTVNSGGSLTISGGKFTHASNSNFVNNGTMTLSDDGELVVNSGSGTFRVGGANDNAKFDITGGKATFNTDVYIATSSNGTINQSGGETVFNSQLALGWGGYSGTYNLTGGTLNTNAAAGLWSGNSAGVSTFNVTGGTANFQKTGESFTVGLGGTNSLANEFYLYSGTVNAKETFAVKYGGTLYVKEKDGTGGDGVLNAKGITLSNNGNLNMSAGTIKLGSGGITNSGDYNITLSGGTFGTNNASWTTSLAATISSNAVTFAPEAGQMITWSGALDGDGGIIKTGAGDLKITAGDNGQNYTGGTTVSAGTLYLEGTNMGKSSVGTGDLTINSGAAVVAQSHNVFGSNIPNVIINGGTLTPFEYLHMNSLEINNGTVSSHGTTGDGLDFSTRNGTITSTGASSIASAIKNSSTLSIDVANDGELTLSGVLTGSGSISKNGAGTLELSGTNTFSGGITVSAGKLLITGNSTGTGKTTNNGAIVEFFADEGETITITNEVGNYESGGVKGKTIKTGAGTLTTNNWISGQVEVQEGTLKLTKQFSSGKRFNGEITIFDGATLDCAVKDALGYDTSNTVVKIYGTMNSSVDNETLNNTELHMYGGTAKATSGSTFDILNTGVKFYSYALTGATAAAPTVSTISPKLVLRHNGTLEINTAANSRLELTGEISGRYKSGNNYTNYTCSITKTGEGTLVLSHRNPDYYGTTTISEGTVIANAPQQDGDSNRGKSVFGTGNVVVASGATLDFQATNQFGYESPNDITIRGTLIPSNFTHVNNVTLENGVIESENGYTSSGSGLDFDTRTVTLASSGTSRIDSRINVNKYSDHLTFNVTGALTVNGVIREGTGNNAGGGFIKAGAGTMELTADNAYTGTTTISAGTIKLSGSGDLGSGNVVNNATLDFAHTADFTGDNAFANIISGTGVVNKTGTGKLTLSGANTYTGMTNVNAGVLELTGDAVVANGPVTVANDGTLEYNVANGQKKKLYIDATNKILSTGKVIKTGEGTLQLYSEAQGLIDISSLTVSSGQLDLKGYMTGGITVDAGGVFSPGNSVGEATFGGGYILKEGATLLIEQDATGIDKLNVGSFTFQENSVSQNIDLDITGIPFGAEYEIIKSTNPFTDDYLREDYWLSHFSNDLPEYMTLAIRNGDTVVLMINRNAVPEPSTWALLILGAAGMLYWRKRKNNK